MKTDLSGGITRSTIRSPLTPLFLLSALAVGLIALLTIAREEEPQISVPMVDIMVSAPGLKAADVVEQVSKPLENILMAIPDTEHIYSQTRDDGALVTARFKVGTNADDAILRVHEKIRANLDSIPYDVPMPLVVGRGINDVPIVTLTLSPDDTTGDVWNDTTLRMLADELRNELTKVKDVGLTDVIGGRPLELRVEPDIQALSAQGVSLQTLVQSIMGAAAAMPSGRAHQDGQSLIVQAGDRVNAVHELERLQIRGAGGRVVYVGDVATVRVTGAETDTRVWTMLPNATDGFEARPAVTVTVAKRPGANAVVVSSAVLERLKTLKGPLIPEGIEVEVTRDYGATANHKANELLFHLGLATVSIVVLIAFSIGWREALVTLIVIPTTILLTLFASLMMGYTINRVSLFALIFAIGILVDDAIVIIENISRHWAMNDGRSKVDAAIQAVSEVGNPTIIATLTVIAALLPMMFVSGLMGPYMAPIPANASAAMVFSFFVAVGIAPWLMMKIVSGAAANAHIHAHGGETRLSGFYRRVAAPVVASKRNAWIFLIAVGVLTLLSLLLFVTRAVPVKLLPFDNKSEVQVIVDLPEGAALEDTERALFALADAIRPVEEVVTLQAYAGTAAPFNFNGLVRHYFLRASPELGDLQVNLSEKSDRKRASHDIALDIRARLAAVPLPPGARVKVVEVPPGPPVMSTLMAEIYGPSPEVRRKTAAVVEGFFNETDFIVDVDNSMGEPAPRLAFDIDEPSAADAGVLQQDILDTIALAFQGQTSGVSPRSEGRDPLNIRVYLPRSERSWTQQIAATPVPRRLAGTDAMPIELGALVEPREESGSLTIFRRDGHFADMVMAELAGRFEAPIYGMFEIEARIKAFDWASEGLTQPDISMYGQPADETHTTVLWDGEWEVTYVTFRDMGLAFGVALIGIYILVVAQFGTFRVPLIILTPVPLTLIGIMIGHWLFGAAFTATSMIGFIALAGIIVRNSILLVDFVRHRTDAHTPLRDVLLDAGAIRFKPILLTALAAMIGAAVILSDPIFQGLAISLLFGLASSTALTVLVIPAIYIALRGPEWTPPQAPTTSGAGEPILAAEGTQHGAT
ncbi:MAG: efflux RND transporter permease subunit [Hyphomonas sp.]|uniref:efflux RND transporter permease subunit n=1 Tax=Hyphomonas sp. TaxID=87 RepID=UPI0018249F15|nr:efflux RND transporter permease subunit [Hyphomonas sp.]MBA3068753.1 efflux RND transporter permease subunit [Hyphomonas sp.]MBU4062686.1 efflux RND transporter permease subunit [Alphaproteobacteria bacterium]MBU4166194.1 efflux RND transporter permease subunit [Alphaproteobacteria bacterium]